MKNAVKIASLLLIVCLVVSVCACAPTSEPAAAVTAVGEVKNVILFIGDGMGDNHIANCKTMFDLESLPFEADLWGHVSTRALNDPVTDSAAAATAMATGQKVNREEVAYHDGKDLTLITSLAKQAGYKVGIVTTDVLNGATPSGFSAHAKNRDNRRDIINSQLASGIDLFIGESTSTDMYRTTYRQSFEDKGYAFATDWEGMQAAKDEDKLIATLDNVRSDYGDGRDDHVQLDDLVRFAHEFLENDEGYFLMVESAHIDKYSSDLDLDNTLYEVRTLFDAVQVAYDLAEEDTAVIVTADHETGSLEKAESKKDLTNDLYGQDYHSDADVPLYIHNFTLTAEGTVIENTQIFHICKQLLGIE